MFLEEKKVVYYTVYRHLGGRTEEVVRFPIPYTAGFKVPKFPMSRLWEIAERDMILMEVISKSLLSSFDTSKRIDPTHIILNYEDSTIHIDNDMSYTVKKQRGLE